MVKKFIIICSIFILLISGLNAQDNKTVAIHFVEKNTHLLPGQITNLAFIITNETIEEQIVNCVIDVPEQWKKISGSQKINLNPSEKKLLIFTVQVPSNCPVGAYNLNLFAIQPETNNNIGSYLTSVTVHEFEKITMSLVEANDNIMAGQTFHASFLVQNQGNTSKKVFIETLNCDMEGSSEIEIKPGESKQFGVYKASSAELNNAVNEYYTVRATISGNILKSIYRSVTIYPSKVKKPDLYFRFPVEVSATYLTSNRQGNLESAYQFQLSGSGTLDSESKHYLEFLARGPNNTNLSFMGLYDQYYISYKNKNLELFAGEKTYSFTPLTESSRFGLGAENKVILNNGLSFGFIYVKPRFYEDIQNELAGFTTFSFNKENEIGLIYISKNSAFTSDVTQLSSLTARLMPFKKTKIDVELSSGVFRETRDNAFRANLSSHFLIFQLSGDYYFTGKNYPGYFSNSSFYSGNFSAQLSKKISLGVSAREDFRNAELDTFFVTAPYTKSFESVLNYNVTKNAYLRVYWREFERKDRLVLDKFHYTTNSVNTQFNHRIKKTEYSLLGEYGKTTNLLIDEVQNQQNTYRGTANFAYRFNSKHSVRIFGSLSNINSFVSGEQRNFTAGLSAASQISKNFRANFHIQNAYDIDDYYRNRNLMQFNVDYNFLKKHSISLRSFYTIFKQQTENPEFTASISYAYKLGVPVKQIINAGDLRGRITYDSDEPAEGIVLTIQNKKAITDKNGEFFISTLQTGIQLLFVERDNFEIDEITNIRMPARIEIIEDQETVLNFKITRGAKPDGKIVIAENENTLLKTQEVSANNIIVELKNEFENFRIATDRNGNFSFPIVRPGEWEFKIYASTIPEGYQIDRTNYTIILKPGEEKHLQFEIKPKKRNIIFKPQSSLLSPLNNEIKTELPEARKISNELKTKNETVFYSVQVGVFSKRKINNSGFFKEIPFDYEKQTGEYYKYFIGRFTSFKEARAEAGRLQTTFKNAFVVVLENEN